MASGVLQHASIPEALAIPRYSFAEADRLTRVSAGTSKRWVRGYTYELGTGKRAQQPPVGVDEPSLDAFVSFVDLIEVAIISRLRKLGFSLAQIREMVKGCQEIFAVPRPLVSKKFKVGGRDAFVERSQGVLVSVLQGKRRTAWDNVLDPFLATVEYQDDWVWRWWPEGRSCRVVIDPDFGYGLPVVQGTSVRTEILIERIEVGESIELISSEFGVSIESVRDALDFERSLNQ